MRDHTGLSDRCTVKETPVESGCGALRLFSAGAALQNLEIPKVFRRFCALPPRKTARKSLLPGFNQCFLNRRPRRDACCPRLLPAIALCMALCLLLSACVPQKKNTSGPSLPGIAAGVPDGAGLVSVDGTVLPAWRVLYWLTLACDRIQEEHQAAGTVPDWNAPAGGNSVGGTADSSTATLSDHAKEQALSDALLYTETESLAEQYGVTLDDTDQAALEGQWAERCAAHGGETAYLQLLSRFGLDRARSMELYRTGRLYGKLCQLCREGGGPQPSDEEYASLERNSGEIRFDRILAAGGDSGGARTKAAAYFVRLNGAADQASLFAELASQGDDPAGPRTLSEGTLDGKLEAALRALEIGQLSGIVESAEGFSILRRLPPERGPLLDAWLDRTLEEAVSAAQVQVSGAWRDLDAGAFAARLAELRSGV